MASQIIPAGEFKQKCLALMDEVAIEGGEIIITKHGKPICRLSALTVDVERNCFGWMKNTVKVHADLTKPLTEKWDVNK